MSDYAEKRRILAATIVVKENIGNFSHAVQVLTRLTDEIIAKGHVLKKLF